MAQFFVGQLDGIFDVYVVSEHMKPAPGNPIYTDFDKAFVVAIAKQSQFACDVVAHLDDLRSTREHYASNLI